MNQRLPVQQEGQFGEFVALSWFRMIRSGQSDQLTQNGIVAMGCSEHCTGDQQM